MALIGEGGAEIPQIFKFGQRCGILTVFIPSQAKTCTHPYEIRHVYIRRGLLQQAKFGPDQRQVDGHKSPQILKSGENGIILVVFFIPY